MASRRNPFRTVERVGSIVGGILFTTFGTLGVIAVCIGVSVRYEWGWWGLLLIPGVPVGLAVLAIVVGLLRLAADSIHDAWLMAKWRWDDRHPDAADPEGQVER